MTYRIQGDVHTHTLFSRHAYSTIGECVAAAREAGLDLLGSTDHFSSMLFDEQTIKNFQFFLNRSSWPRTWDGVSVLRGAEVDIEGLDGELFGQDIPVPKSITGRPEKDELTLFDEVTRGCDYLIASVHAAPFARGASLAQTTAMYVRALESPKVLVLGHTGRAGIPFDLDEVLSVARERGKLIELNEHSLAARGDRTRSACHRIAERCAELGVGVVVNSDAHVAPRIGRYARVEALLAEIGFPEELVANRSAAAFREALGAAGFAAAEAF